MYQVDPNRARTDLYKKGYGEAHSWDFSSIDKAIESNQRFKRAQSQAAQKRKGALQDDLNTQLIGINKLAIHPNDQQYFIDKQRGVYDYVRENIDDLVSGNTNKQVEFNQMMTNLAQEAEMSKNYREASEAVHTGVLQKGVGKFRPESLQAIDEANASPAGVKWDTNRLLPKENFNIDEWVGKDLLTEVQKTSEGVTSEYTDKKTGERVKVNPNKFGVKEAHDLLYDRALSNPQVLEQAAYDLSRQAPEVQDKYNAGSNVTDLARYVADKKYNDLAFDKSSYSRVQTDSDGIAEIERSTPENQMSFNIETSDVQGNPMRGTAPVSSRSTLKKPIRNIGAMSGTVRTVDGNKPVDKSKVLESNFGEVVVVPVYKEGAKNPKGQSLSGNIVPKERLDQEIKKGGVRYEVRANGIAKVKNVVDDGFGGTTEVEEEISITKPASEIEGALRKVVPLDDLYKDAEELNKKLPSANKKEIERRTKDGKIAVFDEDTKQFIRWK